MQKLFFQPTSDTTFTNTYGDVYTVKANTKAAEKCKYSFRNEILLSVKLEGSATTYGTASSGTLSKFSEELLLTNLKKAKVEDPTLPKEQIELMNFIKESGELKPDILKMQAIKWKYLMRSAMRGKNILMTGPAGCGKTMAAKAVSEVLDKPLG